MKVEVRCCCEPQKLLGTIEVPECYLDRRTHVDIPMSPIRFRKSKRPFVRFEVAKFTDHHYFTTEFMDAVERGEIRGSDEFGWTRLALKKPHDVTIDDLRMLSGFTAVRIP